MVLVVDAELAAAVGAAEEADQERESVSDGAAVLVHGPAWPGVCDSVEVCTEAFLGEVRVVVIMDADAGQLQWEGGSDALDERAIDVLGGGCAPAAGVDACADGMLDELSQGLGKLTRT